MIDKATHSERRRLTRCNLRTEDYKIIIGPKIASGGIKDISLGGLSFTYIPIKGDTLEDRAIDTLAIDYGGYQLLDISCNKVYDIPVLAEGQTFSGKATRRCGVRFIDFTILHKFKIKQMLHICKSRILENVSKSKGRRQCTWASI